MNKYKKEDLIDLIINQGLSYEKIGKMYNVSGAAIKKAALKLEIELPIRRNINSKEHFNKGKSLVPRRICINCKKEYAQFSTKNGNYCSFKCKQEHQHKEKYRALLIGDSSIMRGNYSPRAFKRDIMEEQNNKCAICGMLPSWNNKKLVFILDHIDGNAANNKRDNLRCICPNCDSQLETYKSKNKNGARSYYRYHKGKIDN